MANIALQRIQREFKEVTTCEEVRTSLSSFLLVLDADHSVLLGANDGCQS